MQGHKCFHAAAKAAFEKLFVSHDCNPSLFIPLLELIITIVLVISMTYRHRAELLSCSKKSRRVIAESAKKICAVPYEAITLALITGSHWLVSIYIPLIKDTVEAPKAVLSGLNLRDPFTVVMVAYFVVLEVVESRSFKIYVLLPYHQKKAVLPFVNSTAELPDQPLDLKPAVVYNDEKHAVETTDVEETTPMLDSVEVSAPATPTESETTPAPRLNFFERLRIRMEKSRQRELKRLTPANIVARFHARAMSKASITMFFLFNASVSLCRLAPEEYLDATVSSLPMMTTVAALYFIRFAHMVAQGHRFAKAELRQ